MHYELRSESDTPGRTAGSILLGTVIGCLPLYGTHFVLCMGCAKLLGLSRIKAYLAAHINNPLTAPLILGLELAVGHRLLTGAWTAPSFSTLMHASWGSLGAALLLGSLVVGLGAGLLFGACALFVRRRWSVAPEWGKLREEAARRYLEAGISHWEFVRGKLRHDPLYREVLAGPLPLDGVLLDLGCGRGILLTLLLVSRPRNPTLVGVESRPSLAAVARMATAGGARILDADVTTVELPRARAVMIFDLLHYLSAAEQERLIRRATAALEPGGVMLIREPDRARTLRFLSTRVGERLCCVLRGEWRRRLHYRRAEAWCALLRQEGLSVTTHAAWGGTPFANVLLRCVRPA